MSIITLQGQELCGYGNAQSPMPYKVYTMNKYEKRKRKRELKRNNYISQYQDFDNAASIPSLYEAAWDSAKGVMWKQSTQRYLLNIYFQIAKTSKMLHKGKDIRKGFNRFFINERGKVREINSVKFFERVVQKSLCSNILIPILTHNLIADNGASQKGKGTDYAQQRLVKHLSDYYRKYGKDGYVLTIDFKSYFANIEHDTLKKLFKKYFTDERVIKLADDFVDAFGDIGLGLGSETSQTFAISYVNEIDHFIKDSLGIKAYGRYMDDSYIIHPEKNVLKDILSRLNFYFEKYGIQINKNKTCIRKLSQGFTFLKTRFYLGETGKIIRKPCRDSITRERRKLKRHAKLYEQGILQIETINQSFKSWTGSMERRNSRKTVYNMELLYNKLFTKGEKNDTRINT